MAEFCFECYKKYCNETAKIEELIMDVNLDLCERCGEWKPTVIRVNPRFQKKESSGILPWQKNRKKKAMPKVRGTFGIAFFIPPPNKHCVVVGADLVSARNPG